ncbi:T9SS type A sorting domain-containing protein [Bacteroidota bacterium]
MKSLYAIIITIIFSINLSGQSLNSPESIIYDSAHNRYLISNYGDGNILAYDPATGEMSVFATAGLQEPKGSAIYNGVFYVADFACVKGFNLETGQSVFNVNAGTNFVNDLVADNNGNLYLGERAQNMIFKINIATGNVEEWVTTGVDGINGIWFDEANNRLVACFWQENADIKEINLETGEVNVVVSTGYSNLDGITVDNCGYYYVSSQGSNLVFRYDPLFENDPEVIMNNLVNPADIFYNQVLQELCIPEMGANRIEYHHIFMTCIKPLLLEPDNEAEDISSRNINFFWDSVPFASSYRLDISTSTNFDSDVESFGATEPLTAIETLELNTTYYWRVTAYSGSEHTETSDVFSFTTESASSIYNIIPEMEYKLYPNPVYGLLNISWNSKFDKPKRIRVISVKGEVVFCLNHNDIVYNNPVQIELINTQPGIYFTEIIQADNKTIVKKLILLASVF